MRFFLIVLITLVLNTIAYSQDPESKLGRTITREDVLALPLRDVAPRLTLQRALKIAETFVKKKRLDISSCYLFEARWMSYDTTDTTPESGAWEFWWVNIKRGSRDIRIAVSVNGKPKAR